MRLRRQKSWIIRTRPLSDFSREDENLILYTCYPFDAMGFTPDRFFVYARYISGPVLDRNS